MKKQIFMYNKRDNFPTVIIQRHLNVMRTCKKGSTKDIYLRYASQCVRVFVCIVYVFPQKSEREKFFQVFLTFYG